MANEVSAAIAPSEQPERIHNEGPRSVQPSIVLEPPVGWQFVNVRELWQAHELVLFLAWRDIQVRYKQTVLGAAWAILQPLMMMTVFTIFFGKMAHVPSDGVPYPLFVLTGLLPWGFFATAISASANSVVNNEKLITKIYFPRLAVPFASIGAAIVDFTVACLLLGMMMIWYQVRLNPSIIVSGASFGFILLLAMGSGLFLSALNVVYRDFKHVIPFFIQIGMFATPSIYMSLPSSVSSRYAWLLSLNPMTTLIDTFRSGLLGSPIEWRSFILAAFGSILLFLSGCHYFRRAENSFADVI